MPPKPVAPILTKYHCNVCDTNYSSYQSLWIHNKKFHLIDKKDPPTIKKDNQLNEIDHNAPDKSVCTYCNKKLSNSQSRWRHGKICDVKNKETIMSFDFKEELKKIKNEFKQQLNNFKIKSTKNNFDICKPGHENVDILTEDEINHILSLENDSILSLIEHLNFNERLPQNHSFYVSSLNDKHINIFDTKTKSVIKELKKHLFNQILVNQMKNLETICSRSNRLDIFNNLNTKIQSKEFIKNFTDQINTLSYNKRNMIINTLNKSIDTNFDSTEFDDTQSLQVQNISANKRPRVKPVDKHIEL